MHKRTKRRHSFLRRRQLIVEALEQRQLLAADFQLVKDINTASSNASSSPTNLTEVGVLAFFTATTLTGGTELWKSNGTAAGTVQVKDIYAGTSSSSPSNLTNVNGTLFFRAQDAAGGYELWKSNGSAAGTVQVKDIYAGAGSSSPSNLTNVNGTLFFSARDAAGGYELWKSDGTAPGTVQVKDIFAGAASSSPVFLTNVNGTLFFRAQDAAGGQELWKSDGTVAGTLQVKDIVAGTNGSYLNSLTNVSGTFFFQARDAAGGFELWKSDGTATGTVQVKDIYAGTTSSSPSKLTNVNGTLFFQARDAAGGYELWKSDGTAAGTVQVKDIYAGTTNSIPSYLTNVNGTLLFRAKDAAGGYELWKSDGTAAGTVQVKDIYAGTTNSSPRFLTNVNGALFFRAQDAAGGYELWKSDGTAAGTLQVKDIYAGTTSSSPLYLTNVNGTLYFQATDAAGGAELWKSDGTAAGTVQVKDIFAGATGSSPFFLTNLNGTLFFSAQDAASGSELWKSDGTAVGTAQVKDIYAGTYGSRPDSLANVNGTLFFSAKDAAGGYELWKSDGTAAGTVQVKDIFAGTQTSFPSNLTNVNGTLFFSASDTAGGAELWKSDGTAAGTVQVKDIYAGASSSSPRYLKNVNGTLFFKARDATGGYELWKSDGTAAGTMQVKDINAGAGSSGPHYLTNVNGTLFFNAQDALGGSELWKSDGTAAGTVQVKDIYAGTTSSNPRYLTNVNGTLFFRAQDAAGGGYELWKSDGTPAGTVQVKEIYAGAASSNPSNLTNVNGSLYFTANDGIHGEEPWMSDGTSAGTVMITDIAPNGGSASNGIGFAHINNVVYTVASTDDFGQELYALILVAAPTDITLTPNSVSENQPNNTTVGTFSTTNPSSGDTFTYSLVSGVGGADNSSFTVNATTGVLTANSSFNFEVKNAYTIRVKTTNGVGLAFEKQITVNVTNVDETPTALNLSPTTIAENNLTNAVVGTFSTIDPDAGDTFTYSFVTGTGDSDNAAFTISGGQLTANTPFDFETKNSYNIRVRTTDNGGLFFEKTFTINVTDVDEIPPIVSTASFVSSGTLPVGATSLTVTFSEPVIGAGVAANYELRRAGPDGLLGNGDDPFIAIASASVFGNTATLNFSALQEDVYRLIVKDAITDLAGNKLDGDGNNIAGGDLRRDLVVNTASGVANPYRWQEFSSYDQNYGWIMSSAGNPNGNAAMFGGVTPQTWGDGNGLASQMSTDPAVLATLFTNKGYAGSNAMMQADTWLSYSSTNSKHYAALFQVQNSTGSPITWTPSFYYTSYFGWGEKASVAINGSLVWQSTGDNGSASTQTLSISIPANSTSTVIFISASDAPSGAYRTNVLGFFNNSLALPGGLVFVDYLNGLPSVANFSSSNGVSFDVDASNFGTGELVQGTSNAFDGLNRLQVNGSSFAPTASLVLVDENRTLATSAQSLSSLNVSRKVTVPNSGSQDFARTIDVYTNPTGSPITTSLVSFGNLGSDAATTVFATSDGDLIVEPTDLWFGTDDANASGGTPALVHLLHGPFGLQPSSVSVIEDNVQWSYSLTVAPGETKRIASFTVLGTTRQQAIDAANALVTSTGFGGQASAFLTGGEVASLANFHFNVAPTNLQISTSSIAENSGANAVVGTFSTTDANLVEGDTHTYSLVAGTGSTDNAAFAVSGNQLKANQSFDFETKSSYSIRVRTTDALGLFFEQTFTINVTDVNESVVLTRANASVTGNVLTQLTNTGTWSDPESGAVTLSASLGTVTKNVDGTWSWTHTPSVALLNQVVTISASDGTNVSNVTFSVTAYTTIATRGIQYVGASGASASTSLATDKVPLLPGQSSTFANYTNYSRGLNGLVIDVVGLPASVTNSQLAASLLFANWDGIDVAGFVALPGAAIPTVAIVAGGVAGSTRVLITFPDNTLQNTWLRVTVIANADTGLAANDFFYFGNVLGDFNVDNTATRIRVNELDTSAVRNNQSTGTNSVGVTNIYDVNRDGRVNAQDTSFVRNNQQTSGIVAPITAPSSFGRSGGAGLGGQGDTSQDGTSTGETSQTAASQTTASQGDASQAAASQGDVVSVNGQMPSGVPNSQSVANGAVQLIPVIPAIGLRLTGESYDVPRAALFSIDSALPLAISQESGSENAILPEEVSLKKRLPELQPSTSQLDTLFACLAVEFELSTSAQVSD